MTHGLFTGLTLLLAAPAATSDSRLGVELGDFGVGFAQTVVQDSSRRDVHDAAAPRTLRMSWWYPAAGGSGMVYGDYVRLLTAEPDQPADEWAAFARWTAMLGDGELSAEDARAALSGLTVAARLNARPLPGPFSLIVFPAHPAGAAVLAEALASRGFVVASFPVQGTWTAEMELDVTAMETTAKDMAFVARDLQARAYVDDGPWTAMGLGFNASAALVASMNHARLRAVISLEGGITTAFESRIIERASAFSIYNATTPMLVIHAPHEHVDVSRVDRYRYSERVYAFFPQMTEFYFLSFGALESHLPGLLGPAPGDTQASLAQAARLIVSYLDDPMRLGSTVSIAADNEIVHIATRPALPMPPTNSQWLAILQDQGIAAVANRRGALQNDPQPISRSAYAQMDRALFRDGASEQDQLKLLELNLSDYPDSVVAHYALGHLHQDAGRHDLAATFYRGAAERLAVDPDRTLTASARVAYREAIESRLADLVDRD